MSEQKNIELNSINQNKAIFQEEKIEGVSDKDKFAESFDSEKAGDDLSLKHEHEKVDILSHKSLKKTNNRYENDEMNHIRLNKSCEPIKEVEVRQHMHQFDFEYMCRCLGLALMKHIEASKEKFHILELISNHEKFDFFNSIYNMNIDFFNTFYNLEAKMSNLDKIDQIEYTEKHREGNKVGKSDDVFQQKISQSELDKIIKKEELRSGTLGHIKYTQSEVARINELNRHQDKDDFTMFDKKNQSSELINELNAINDYFKTGNKVNLTSLCQPKENNPSENVKTFKTRGQELSLIREEDSHLYCSSNMLLTVENEYNQKENKNVKNVDYINLLQTSVANFLGVNVNEEDINNQKYLNEVNK